MARAGRARKAGARERNGRIQRPTTVAQIEAAEAEQRRHEMSVVLAQPHRRGDEDQLCASALGRFVKAHGLRRELYDAGEQYANLKRQWLAFFGAPMPDRLSGSGTGVTLATAQEWGRRLDALEIAVATAAPAGYGLAVLEYVRSMAVDGIDPAAGSPIGAIERGLLGLAIELGRIDKNQISAIVGN